MSIFLLNTSSMFPLFMVDLVEYSSILSISTLRKNQRSNQPSHLMKVFLFLFSDRSASNKSKQAIGKLALGSFVSSIDQLPFDDIPSVNMQHPSGLSPECTGHGKAYLFGNSHILNVE
jgi:hypothetical protein